MRVLAVNPLFVRLKAHGACEQDRLKNLQALAEAGHTVQVLTYATPGQTDAAVADLYTAHNLEAVVLPFRWERLHATRFSDPAFLDGAAWQYAQPHFLKALDDSLQRLKPDLVWCHGSYNWPPARFARERGYKTVIRSVNYEPSQLLHEDGFTPANLVRYTGKVFSERRALSNAAVLAAITPVEADIYRRINPQAVISLLPLATLPDLLRPPHAARNHTPLHVFFMGATFNVRHNLLALRFLIEEVIPAVRSAAPGCFVFHIFGSKAPESLRCLQADDLLFEGYVNDLEARLAEMDIAVSPSLRGVGMQQKVFEPLCRGFPTITHRRALAGYRYTQEEHVLLAETAADYVRQLLRLTDPALRQRLAEGATHQSTSLFGQEQLTAYRTAILQAAQT